MKTTYPLYGLEVACDREIELWSHRAGHDLSVSEGSVEPPQHCVHDLPDPGGEGRLRVYADNGWTVEYDGWRFAVGGDAVTYQETDTHRSPFGLVLERVVVPLHRLVRHASMVAFHGSAVVSNGRAFVFVGASGAGKSTTARLVAADGADLATDDLTLIDRVTRRLLPGGHGVRSFDPIPDSEPVDLYPNSAKKWYPLAGPPPLPCKLAAIVHVRRTDRWHLAPAKGAQAGVLLLRHAFDLENPPERWRERRMRNIMEIGRSIPLVLVEYPANRGAPDHGTELMRRLRDFLDGSNDR